GYVKDAKVASAKAVITTITNSEKVHRQRTGSFVNVTSGEFEGDPDTNPLGIDIRDSTQFWTLSVTDATDAIFNVTATGKAGSDYADTTVTFSYDVAGDDTWEIDGQIQ
ncbi:MAG: hypothetical protein SVW57_05625, partial [Thermodesulfobacteriota bacterium]|nr:hypothetical protein [Thermodesulfobacteriota bacterium]